eukprot:gene5612-9429_t
MKILVEGTCFIKNKDIKEHTYAIYESNQLIISNLQTSKSRGFELIGNEKPNSFQILHNEAIPFCLQISLFDTYEVHTLLMMGFKSLQDFSSFIKLLVEYNYTQIPTDFSKFETKLSSKKYTDWNQTDISEWLSYISVGEFTLGELYEGILVPHISKGANLAHLDLEILSILGVNEEHGKVLLHECSKLTYSNYRSTDALMSFKLSKLCADVEQDEISILNKERDLFYSLGNPTEIQSTYLSLTPHQYLHPNCEKSKNLKSIPVRLIFTEIVYNSSELSLISSLSGLISGIPMTDFNDRRFAFKSALIIGPFYLEFTDTSLCVPKRITSEVQGLFERIQPIATCDLKLSSIVTKLSKLISEWNTKYSFVSVDYSDKKKEGNCISFVEKVLSTLNVKLKFNGALGNFVREMKEFGDSTASIYPGVEFEKKFNFHKMQDIFDHLEFDDKISEIFEMEPNVDKKFPHDYLIVQAIDLAFWIRFIFTNDEIYEPMMDHKISLCSCFKKKFFDKIPIELWSEDSEDFKKSLRRKKSSITNLKIKSANSLVKKKKLRLDFDNKDEKEYFRKYCEEKLMIEYFLYYEIYMKYIEEENLDNKYKLGKSIYEDFIIEDSKNQIYLSKKLLTKVKKFCKTDSTRGFQMVYKEVCAGLQPAYDNFLKSNYKNEFIQKEKQEVVDEEDLLPATFDQLLKSKVEHQLFTKYVSNTFGRDYIECYHDIQEYEKTKDEIVFRDIERIYCKKFGSHFVVHNPTVYEEIMHEEFNDDSIEELKSYLYRILYEEYYPRFVNSQIWKDHIHLSVSLKKDTKFQNRYTIIQKEKEDKTFTKTELLTVKHKLSGEIFKAKKIVSSKTFLSKQSIEYLEKTQHDNILKLIEIFHEEEQSFDTSSLTIITNTFDISLNEFLEKTTEYIQEIFLLGYFREMLSAMEEFHKNSKYFDEGELIEENIYIQTMYDKILIDPGFYNELNEIPSYLQIPEEETSEKSNIYMLGFLFIRMISLLPIERIQELFDNTPKYNKEFSSTKGQNLIDEIKKLKTEYSSSILNLVLQMIEINPNNRPNLKELIDQFTLIYQKLTKDNLRKESMSLAELNGPKKALIKEELQRRYLKAWTRSEYTTETVLFYEDVMLFSKMESNQERLGKAMEIYDSYFHEHSDLEINISGDARRKIAMEIEQSKLNGFVDDEIFHEAQNHVVQTLFINGFIRFTLCAIGLEWKEYREKLAKETKKRVQQV